MRGGFTRLLAAVTIVGAMIAFTVSPAGAQEFDEEAARAEVVANLTSLFENLAIAGNPDSDAATVEQAIEDAAAVIEGGDSQEVKDQIPGIAALAFAADLEIVIDEEPTFNEDGTQATYVFSALSGGNPSQVNEANGVHVLEDGAWKLSSDLWGAFVALGAGASTEDVEPDGEDDGDTGATDEDAGDDEELATTGVDSDVLAILALAVVGAGAMLVASSRRPRHTD